MVANGSHVKMIYATKHFCLLHLYCYIIKLTFHDIIDLSRIMLQ